MVQWFEKSQNPINWKEFEYGLRVRFGPNVYEDAIGELTKLCQNSTVKSYQERFEELANRTQGLTQEFFVSCFLSGLKEEIRAAVQMFHPTTITQAIGLARLQEETIEAISRKSRLPLKPSGNWGSTSQLPTTKFSNPVGFRTDPKSNMGAISKPILNHANPVPVSNPQFPVKKLTQMEMDARREKGLCFNCDRTLCEGS